MHSQHQAPKLNVNQSETTDSVAYEGRDLEAMCFAENYHRWIVNFFDPYLGNHLVEVGAGTGSFSKLLLERKIESLALVEPSTDMHTILSRRMANCRGEVRLETFNAVFTNVADQIRLQQQPDSIIYANVMEHIEDDERELAAVHRTLELGGRLFIFVPALQWLFGSYDTIVGHHRRYSRIEIEGKCKRAGFTILRSGYFDFPGILTWAVKYRLLRSRKMEPGAVRFYDKRIVPIVRSLESIIAPPIGKNLILVAEKI
jgi:SAM-dependent methyltransferase